MALPVSTLWSTCPDCGRPFEREAAQARCPDCHPAPDRTVARIMGESRRGSRQARGYGATWERLSKRARRLQPWCSDCGRGDKLTTDHSPEAWSRHDRGLRIRLRDVDVVCRECNARRGPARGPDAVERPTIGTTMDALEDLTDELADEPMTDDDTIGLDERLAREDR